MLRKTIISTSLFFLSTQSLAGRIETAGAFYKEDSQSTFIESLSTTFNPKWIEGEGYGSSFSLGLTAKQTEYSDKNDPVVKQLNGETELKQFSGSGSFSQGLGIGRSVGANFGLGDSRAGSSKWLGVNFGEWWLEETFQTVFSATRTWVEQIPYSTLLPGDLQRVYLPENVDGWNFGVSFYQLTTPNLILRGGYNLITRSDRPNAHALNAEGRYYVEPTRSAIHLKGAYYLNVGEVKPVSLYGEVEAYSASLEWHQRLAKQWILMGGYRYYFEKETPVAATASINQIGSDYFYGSLRWRFADVGWTAEESPEIYVFGGFYQNNEPNKAYMSGIGASLYF